MNRSRSHRRRHRWSTRGKALFYAGSKGDGSPRGWTLADLVVVTVCFGTVIFAVIFVLNWLWNTGFIFGK